MADADRREILATLFQEWDLDGNGAVGFGELLQVLQSSEQLATKDSQKYVKKIEAQIAQAKQLNRKRGSSNSLKLNNIGTISFSEADGQPSLDPEAFVNFLSSITQKDSDDEFTDFVNFCKSGVEEAMKNTHGSAAKRLVWNLFQMLDANNDGFVDLDELEVLLKAESKSDKKHVLKWKAYLLNKGRDENKIREEDLADDTHARESSTHRLTLNDFHQFIREYTDGDEGRVAHLVASVETALEEKQMKYILENKVQDVINDIMADLLRERPKDVLLGIRKSVERLQRTNKFPRLLVRRASSLTPQTSPQQTGIAPEAAAASA